MFGRPSIHPYRPFDANEDAEVLRNAMKGFGTDKGKIINVLCNRCNAQRQQISDAYLRQFDRHLVKDLKSELSGDFEDLIVALMEIPAHYDANEIHRAIHGVGTREKLLIEILCSRTNGQLSDLRHAYKQIYGKSVDTVVKRDTHGSFEDLLVALCKADRDESGRTDSYQAAQDAERLYKAGEKRFGTDESCFFSILTSQSYPQLRLVFQEYRNIANHPIEKALKSEFSDDVEDALLALVACIQNRAAYFAEKLHDSMKGFGTRDKDLIRILVTRSEVDLGDIADEYQRIYGKSLEAAIKGDTTGAYEDALVTLVRGN